MRRRARATHPPMNLTASQVGAPAGSGRDASDLRGPTPALPPRARWLFVAAPPFLAYLFDPGCAHEVGAMSRAMLALMTYTIVVGLSVHHGFEWVNRRTERIAGWLRSPIHVVFTAATAAAVSLPLLPLMVYVYPEVRGDELTIVSRGVLISLAYLAFASFVGHLQRQAVRERTIALEARLSALRAQMQPHFLFNSLNVCAGLVHEEPDVAEETLDRLAGFLRYTLESTEERLVPLDEELDAVRSYLEIQQRRFGDRLAFEVEAPTERWSVPPMVLQPLVENAVLHGVRERGGHIWVRASVERHQLVLVVEDDGVGDDGVSAHGAGFGQRNVRERLELIYGGRARFEVEARRPRGYRCTLTLPAAR